MSKETKAKIYYYDIGDYLNRDEKLKIVKNFKSFLNMPLKELEPNEHGDWLLQRSSDFNNFIPLEPIKKFDNKSSSCFILNSLGLISSRDSWVYNSSKESLIGNMKRTIEFYNAQVMAFSEKKKELSDLKAENFIDRNPQKISWSSSLIPQLEKAKTAKYEPDQVMFSSYRPFNKLYIYMGDKFIHRRGQFEDIFHNSYINKIICVSGTNNGFCVLITDNIVDRHYNGDTQCFPLYYYEERQKQTMSIFDHDGESEYIRRDGISDFILDRAKKQYGKNVTKEDIFYYVYGFLHSPEYRTTFANDLKKMLPRLPLVDDVKDFWAFSKAGRKLADLHINYESVPPAKDVIVLFDRIPQDSINKAMSGIGLDSMNYRVEKMRFPSKGNKSTIIYNSQITIDNIPAKAYEYVVNGKSAIEWIMERYQVTVHKESGIKNDPNDWAQEVGKPSYILDLLLSIINVSVQTVDIVAGLPGVRFE